MTAYAGFGSRREAIQRGSSERPWGRPPVLRAAVTPGVVGADRAADLGMGALDPGQPESRSEAGREGLGKTALLGDHAARSDAWRVRGTTFMGARATSVYVGDEDDRSFASWCPALPLPGADLDRVHFMDLPAGSPILNRRRRRACSTISSVRSRSYSSAIDPLDSHLGQSVDSHRKAEVQRAIGRLAPLAERHRCGLVGLAVPEQGRRAATSSPEWSDSVGFTTASPLRDSASARASRRRARSSRGTGEVEPD